MPLTMTELSSAITAFISDLKVRKSKLTVIAYQSHLRRLAAKAPVDSVRCFMPELIRLELQTASAAGIKMSTLHGKRACFNTFGKWGVKHGLWVKNPVDDIEPIRSPQHAPRPFSTDELVRLAALRLPAKQAMLRLILTLTGLRVTPICHLKVGDVSFRPPEIRAWVKGAKMQVILLQPILAETLRAYITKHTDGKAQSFLFPNRRGGPMHRLAVEGFTKHWGAKAHVPACTPHRFRHKFATDLYDRTRDIRIVKEAMGHADIGSTIVYAEVTNHQLRSALETLAWPPSAPGSVSVRIPPQRVPGKQTINQSDGPPRVREMR